MCKKSILYENLMDTITAVPQIRIDVIGYLSP